MVLTYEDINAIAEAVVKKLIIDENFRRIIRGAQETQPLNRTEYPAALNSDLQRRIAAANECRRKSQERRVQREARYAECLQSKSAVTLRTARGKKGISQEQLSELTNIPLKDIRAFELGRRIPSPNQANALANILNIDDYQDFI